MDIDRFFHRLIHILVNFVLIVFVVVVLRELMPRSSLYLRRRELNHSDTHVLWSISIGGKWNKVLSNLEPKMEEDFYPGVVYY